MAGFVIPGVASAIPCFGECSLASKVDHLPYSSTITAPTMNTVSQQLEAMRAAVRRELPALAGEMLTLSSQGFMDGGRFRELAAALTEIPAEIRLNTVMSEINRAALEVVRSPAVPVRESHGLTALAKIEHAAKRRAIRDYREAVLTEHECRALLQHFDRILSARSDGLTEADVLTLIGDAEIRRRRGESDLPAYMLGLAERIAIAIGDRTLAEKAGEARRAMLPIAPLEREEAATRRSNPSWSLHDRVEFALRDAGFDYDEASRIAVLASAKPSAEAAASTIGAVASSKDLSQVSAAIANKFGIGEKGAAAIELGLRNFIDHECSTNASPAIFASHLASWLEANGLLRGTEKRSAFVDEVIALLDVVTPTLGSAGAPAGAFDGKGNPEVQAKAIYAFEVAMGGLASSYGVYLDKGFAEHVTCYVINKIGGNAGPQPSPAITAQAIIDACIPGGANCDPQQVADNIRSFLGQWPE